MNYVVVQFPVKDNAEIGVFVCTFLGSRGPGEHVLPPSPVASLHQSQRCHLPANVTDISGRFPRTLVFCIRVILVRSCKYRDIVACVS